MTRINCLPIETLSDKHLLAEYKEITRPFNKVAKRIKRYGIDKALNNAKSPDNYVLNKGHESFFFNKLKYLSDRYDQLFQELLSRGNSLNQEKYFLIQSNIQSTFKNTPYWNDWKPSPDDMYLNMARLVNRARYAPAIEERDYGEIL